MNQLPMIKDAFISPYNKGDETKNIFVPYINILWCDVLIKRYIVNNKIHEHGRMMPTFLYLN